MVRKRSRTSRKYYESDENDSDSDFALEPSPAQPTQKKYSLRQRKRPLFTEDFDYDDDGEEIVPPKAASDDEDFEVDQELELDEEVAEEYDNENAFLTHYEQENEDELPQDADGLIDFEDMIRADIVVNKNRIDYDNIIQKTEIKVQPIVEAPPVKSKRGRKPKIRPVEEVDSSILEPETEVQEEAEYEDKKDKDYNPDDDIENEAPIDCAQIMQTELKEDDITKNDNLPNNEEISESTKDTKAKSDTSQTQEEEKDDSNIPEENNICQESVIKVNDNFSKDVQINGKVSPTKLIKPEEKLEITKEENDDDDVVLVEDEKKCEVIVLDD